MKLFNGELPRQILIGFIRQDRVNGTRTVNPFKFEHFDLSYLNLRINGMSCPVKPYTPDFGAEIIARELRALYDNTVSWLYVNFTKHFSPKHKKF